MDLQTQLLTFNQKHHLITPGETLIVGVSGGVDSLSLLHLLQSLAPQFQLNLHVAHFNHNLRPTADADALYLIDQCWAWGLPIHVEKGMVAEEAQASGRNLEAVAREMRYQFLCNVAQAVGAKKIAVAHHANDQAETVLMNLIRGASLRGLRGMLPKTPLSNYVSPNPPLLIRPLLEVTRPELEAYCAAQQLHPRHDETNSDLNRFRNHLRQEIIPQLTSHNPKLIETLGRTSQILAAEYDSLRQNTHRSWRYCLHWQSENRISLDKTAFANLPLASQRRVLRHALKKLSGSLENIRFDHLEAIINLVAAGQADSQLNLPRQIQINLQAQHLILKIGDTQPPAIKEPHLKLTDLPLGHLKISVPGTTALPGTNWLLQTSLHRADSLSQTEIRYPRPWQAFLDAAVVGLNPILRGRQPGDYFYPLGLNGHRQKVKDFMINAKIPAENRAFLPLLSADTGQIHWLCGWRVDHRARITAHTQQILELRFERAG
jgi:tRNA(Ile)-lysidine synthase